MVVGASGDSCAVKKVLMTNEDILKNEKVAYYVDSNIQLLDLVITTKRILLELNNNTGVYKVICTYKQGENGDSVFAKISGDILYLRINERTYEFTVKDAQEWMDILSKRKNMQVTETDKEYFDIEANVKKARIEIVLRAVGSFLSIAIGVYKVLNGELWGLIMVIVGGIGANYAWVAYSTRCPYCGRLKAMYTRSSKTTNQRMITKLVNTNIYNSKHEKIGSKDEYVNGVQTTTSDIYECKYCKYQRTVTRVHDSI